MKHLGLLRNHPSHQLTQQQLTAHPDLLGRLLYFLLPLLFGVITTLLFLSRNARIHKNHLAKTYSAARPFVLGVLLAGGLGIVAVGIYAVAADAWTVKEWIIFAVLATTLGLKAILLAFDSHLTLLASTVLTIFAAITNQLLFVTLADMSEAGQTELGWKHATRNFVGFLEAVLIISSVQHVAECLVQVVGVSERNATRFFWIAAPLTLVGILVWSILSYGPLLDLIGYIVGGLVMLLGAADSTLFHKEEEKAER